MTLVQGLARLQGVGACPSVCPPPPCPAQRPTCLSQQRSTLKPPVLPCPSRCRSGAFCSLHCCHSQIPCAPNPTSGLWVVTQIPGTSLSLRCCTRTRAALHLSPCVFRVSTGHPRSTAPGPPVVCTPPQALYVTQACVKAPLPLWALLWPVYREAEEHIQLKLSVGVAHLVKKHLPHQRDWEGPPQPTPGHPWGQAGGQLCGACLSLPFPVGTRAHSWGICRDPQRMPFRTQHLCLKGWRTPA